MAVALVALGLSLFQVNEALFSPPDVAAFMEIGSKEHLNRLMANMTLESAFEHVRDVPRELQHLLHLDQHRLGGQAFLQARTAHTKVSSSTHIAQKAKSMGADEARVMLNSMLYESEGKIDVEKVQCAETCATQHDMMLQSRQDVSNFNAEGAQARSRVLVAQAAIAEGQENLPELKDALKLHKQKCKEDKAALEKQMSLVVDDAAVLTNVLSMTSCAGAGAASMLQCQHASGRAVVSFKHEGMRQKLEGLKSSSVRDVLERTLSQIAQGSRHHMHRRMKQQHYKEHRHHRHLARRHPTSRKAKHRAALLGRHHKRKGKKQPDGLLGEPSMGDGLMDGLRGPMLSGPMLKEPMPEQRCSIAENADCDTLKDKFVYMQADVDDKIDDMKDDIAKNSYMCHETEESFLMQIEDIEGRLGEAQAVLATATSQMISADEQSRLKSKQVSQLQLEGHNIALQCDKNLHSIAMELCGLRQIRQELYKMNSQQEFIQDCELSSWTPEECTTSCGGGQQVMKRTVVTPPSKGSDCQPTDMRRKCAEHPCPVDCVVGDWSGWSSCTAKCGGGIMERLRGARQHAEHGGQPCGQLTQTETCGNDACDQDCELSQWTAWGTCSKACGGGFEVRERHAVSMAQGDGSCPAKGSPARMEYMRCNETACAPTEADGLLVCTAKLDVVVLLDGSASLGAEGWEATKTAAKTLVEGFETGTDGSQVAVLLFSGPTSWDGYQKCTSKDGAADMATDCKISWVSPLSPDSAAVAGAIDGLTWPKGTTLTSAALSSVDTELMASGRPNVQKVVIIITDGRPMNARATGVMAEKLKQSARLLWVTVGDEIPMDEVKLWASQPIADNVLALPQYDDLPAADTINKIMADACPTVK